MEKDRNAGVFADLFLKKKKRESLYVHQDNQSHQREISPKRLKYEHSPLSTHTRIP